jgi:CRP-like cAMP-binding protein
MINEDILLAWGASYATYHTGDSIFEEGSTCFYYNQLISGKIKWINENDSGKEFIHEIIDPGQSFGEIPLFDEGPFVATAIALEESVVIKLQKKIFSSLLADSPGLYLNFLKLMTKRLRYKFDMMKTNAFECPEKRITVLLNHIKREKSIPETQPYHVDLTRQQIANITGLRVETVIRTVRQLSKRNELQIDQGKIIF